MKALTIKQPWATLIALGEKKIETRSWSTKYRGPLLIHAGKSVDKLAMKTLCIKEALAEHGIYCAEDLPTGCIIAKSNLDDVCRVEKANDILKQAWTMDKDGHMVLLAQNKEYDFGGYISELGKRRYGWNLSNIQSINPIYCKGQLSLWEYKEE